MTSLFDQNIVTGRKVIDFHTHPYRKRGEFMGMYGEHFYLPPEQMPEDLAGAGISVFCGSVIDSDHRGAMESFDRVREVNDAALKLREKFGDAYVPGFHVHPAFLTESLAEVERMHAEGVGLVGELVPYLQGWQHAGCDYGSEALMEILARAGEYGMVVSYHTMPEWAPQMEKMVSRNPGVTFVAAHPGQKDDRHLCGGAPRAEGRLPAPCRAHEEIPESSARYIRDRAVPLRSSGVLREDGGIGEDPVRNGLSDLQSEDVCAGGARGAHSGGG